MRRTRDRGGRARTGRDGSDRQAGSAHLVGELIGSGRVEVAAQQLADFGGTGVELLAERAALSALTQDAMRVLRSASAPHGFNLGINQGAVAGAGIAAHLHQHVVPRWAGDANFLPVVGQTKALPQLLDQTWEVVRSSWDAYAAAGDR